VRQGEEATTTAQAGGPAGLLIRRTINSAGICRAMPAFNSLGRVNRGMRYSQSNICDAAAKKRSIGDWDAMTRSVRGSERPLRTRLTGKSCTFRFRQSALPIRGLRKAISKRKYRTRGVALFVGTNFYQRTISIQVYDYNYCPGLRQIAGPKIKRTNS
jgi:hypothetical protein